MEGAGALATGPIPNVPKPLLAHPGRDPPLYESRWLSTHTTLAMAMWHGHELRLSSCVLAMTLLIEFGVGIFALALLIFVLSLHMHNCLQVF